MYTGESEPLDENEIEKEKLKLPQEVKRLDIYNNCEYYELDKFLYYFPNKAKEIRKCFYEEGGWYFLQPEKKEQLQNIIMYELCLLLYPYIEKGFKVKPLDVAWYNSDHQKYLICLNTLKDDKNIGISIGKKSKTVSTNAVFDDGQGKYKLRFFPNSGIQINHYIKDNKFHNEIKIFDSGMDYTLIIYPDTNIITLTGYDEKKEYKIFCYQNDEIFKNKEDIIHFFSTLSFAEIEQVLQVSNKHLKDKKYYEVDIGTVLNEIKNKIEEKRNEEKKNEENSISNNPNGNFNPINNIINNSNNLIPNNNSNNNLSFSCNNLNKDLNQKNTFVNVNDINNGQINKSNIIENEPIIKENNENTVTALNEINNTIEENRNEEKKNEENNISNIKINKSNISEHKPSFEEDDKNNKSETKKNDDVFDNKLNEINNNNKSSNNQNKEEIDNKNENKNSNDGITKTRLEIEKEDKTSCNDCITCLKQCWPSSEKEK